jgi:hypothetical protein
MRARSSLFPAAAAALRLSHEEPRRLSQDIPIIHEIIGYTYHS